MRKFFGRTGRQRTFAAISQKKSRSSRRNNAGRNVKLGLELLEPRRVLAAGDLDPTFGIGGLVADDLGLVKDEEINATAIQADGRIVVAGLAKNAGTGLNDFLIARYNPDGSRDTSFGTNGATIINMSGGNLSDIVNDLVIDSLGRIIVAGSAESGGFGGFGVARLTATGQLDTTFDGDGRLITILQRAPGVNVHSFATAVSLQADGKIVVGGTAQAPTFITNNDFAVARYNSNGSLDTSFGTIGYVLTDFYSVGSTGRPDDLFDVAIQSDGRIVAVGHADTALSQDFAIARYNSNGTLDTTFGVGGKVSTDIVPTAFVSQDRGVAVELEPDGQIVVGGFATIRPSSASTASNLDFILARYNANGTLDATFAPSSVVPGTLRIEMGTTNDIAEGMALQPQPDGKYVIAGRIGGNIAGLARVTVNGQLDTTFSGDGIVTTAFPGTTVTRFHDVTLQPDGKIVAVGRVNTIGGNQDIAIARFESGLALQSISGLADVNEGATYTLNLSSNDPSTSQWTINWGDSVEVVPGNPSSVTHVYADGDASYTISATVTTDDGTFTVGNTVAVAVHNVAPTLIISGAADVNEGSSYTLNLSSSDPGSDIITSWTINWGDTIEVVAGNPASVTHTYADGDANYTISATATDEDGTFAAGNTVAVMVLNVAPTLAISGAPDADEGTIYTLNLSSSDPGSDMITSWTINWGDTIEVVAGNPASATHTYADGDANYTISATATDEDGTFAAGNTVAVMVLNVAPTLAISGAADVNEGSSYTLDLSSSDPGSDTITSWTINWGDTIEVVAGNPANATHTYADGDANYVISATATDEDGTFVAGNTVTVMVHNVAPTLAISGAADVDEGSSYTLDLSSSDPGSDTITSWTINWGDTIEVVAGNPASVTHTYADGDANYVISATATDEDGTFAAGNTVPVSVLNVAPTLAITGAPDVDEGSSYTLDLSSSDPGSDTITSWTINWGDTIEVVAGNPASATHTYADGDASYNISATATDEDGTFAAGNTVDVAVHNVAPTLTISGATDVNEGSSYTLNLASSDPGSDTITSWTINWGDATEVVIGNPASITHTYADGDANYVISATATDEDGSFAAGNTVTVTVDNVAPALAISGASNVNEGTSYTLNLSSSDPGSDTITSWTINWGDGTQVVSGNPASITHTYADGNANYVISASATDEDGTFAAGNTVSVMVNNVAPTPNAGGPYFTFDDTPITLNGSGTDPAGAADPLTFAWDLDNNGTFETSGANPVFDPDALGYSGTQTRTVTLRVSDGDGGQSFATATVEILGVGSVLIGGVLHIVGSESSDIVLITRCNDQIFVYASFNSNNPMVFSSAAVTEINVRMRGGHDIVLTTPNVMQTMTIDGGSGNDLLTGGGGQDLILGGSGHDFLYGDGGNDVLLGGTGNDDLCGGSGNDALVGGDGCDFLDGGSGRDLIIGSQDEDELKGGNDEDILVGGYTIHDNNVTALDAIMAIWGSSASFSSRVATLSGSGGMLQAGVAVFDDDDCDEINGGSGRDLVFGDTYRWDGAVDSISLQSTQDILIAVN